MRRGALVLWTLLTLVWVAIAVTLPHLGPPLLHRIHLNHPNSNHRAQALTVRALHRWERAMRAETPDRAILRSAIGDLDEAERLRPAAPGSTRDHLRAELSRRLADTP